MDQSKELISLVQRDKNFFNKLLSRDSSTRYSSGFYFHAAAQVPFKWESEPGTPINPHAAAYLLPPLSPPPAMLGAVPPRRCSTDLDRGSTRKSIWFWKKNKSKRSQLREEIRVRSLDVWSSDDADSVSMPRDSSCSSSASSAASFDGSSPGSGTRARFEGLGLARSCSLWKFRSVVGCIAR